MRLRRRRLQDPGQPGICVVPAHPAGEIQAVEPVVRLFAKSTEFLIGKGTDRDTHSLMNTHVDIARWIIRAYVQHYIFAVLLIDTVGAPVYDRAAAVRAFARELSDLVALVSLSSMLRHKNHILLISK